jgi:hypothetical protein
VLVPLVFGREVEAPVDGVAWAVPAVGELVFLAAEIEAVLELDRLNPART